MYKEFILQLKVSTKKAARGDKPKVERVYILELLIDGLADPIYKIGKASGESSKKRLLEIIGSYFDAYRVNPIVRIVRDRKTKDALLREGELHVMFEEYSYKSKKKFSGCTELFKGVDLDELISQYERIV